MVIEFWAAFSAASLAAFPIYRGLLAIRARQNVSEHLGETHRAKQGTPTMGGSIVLVGMAAGVAAAFLLRSQALPIGTAAGLALLVLGFAAIGFLDDYWVPHRTGWRRGLPWKLKLALQVLAAGLAVVVAVPGGALAGLAAGFAILFFANAFNFTDGLDGLAGGVLILLLAFYAIVSIPAGLGVGGAETDRLAPGLAPTARILAPVLIASVVPFLVLNAPPARLFLGDLGALPLGALLGLMAFETLAEAARTGELARWSLALIVLHALLVVELVLVPIQIAWVKVFGRRLFVRTPIHHAFEYWGWPETRIVALFLLVQGLLTVAALQVVGVWGPAPGDPR